MTDINLPFGNPDGSRAEINDLLDGFVKFNNEALWGGLALNEKASRARVIVGRKGAGKTLYLRRLHADATTDSAIYAEPIEQSLPQTEEIIKFCHWFPERFLTEKWMALWHIAIIRTVTQNLLYASQFKSDSAELADLIDEHNLYDILPPHKVTSNCYNELRTIIQSNSTENDINKFLNNPKWHQLEQVLKSEIKKFPPIYFYIDAIDEEFAHAPMYWLRCQKGLFYQTMRFLRNSTLGGRLHVTICIRDLVMTSVLRSEHKNRYKGEPHIKTLTWNRDSCRYLIARKIENLDDVNLKSPNKDNLFERWLGQSMITNGLGKRETIEQYLLRHTRLIPRDIIILGNELTECVLRCKSDSTLNLENSLKLTVSRVARDFADEQLQICANHVASNIMPNEASKYDYTQYYTGGSEHIVNEIYNSIVYLITDIAVDTFNYAEMDRALDKYRGVLKNDVFDVLWEHGLIGYRDHKRNYPIFYNGDNFDEFNLPRKKSSYVFHPCIFDRIHIKNKSQLIVPFEEIK